MFTALVYKRVSYLYDEEGLGLGGLQRVGGL